MDQLSEQFFIWTDRINRAFGPRTNIEIDWGLWTWISFLKNMIFDDFPTKNWSKLILWTFSEKMVKTNRSEIKFSRRRRTFVQWSHSHSRFLFCPDPTTTLPGTFGDTVKKTYIEFGSELPDTPYIPLEKNNTKVDSLYQPKNRCISDPDQPDNARIWSSDHQHNSDPIGTELDTGSLWMPPTPTTEPEAPTAVHGRL